MERRWIAGLALALLAGCRAQPKETPQGPEVGSGVRVGGDAQATSEWVEGAGEEGGGAWRCGPCSVRTPLPAGYPPPTPPGALELKSYPAVRRAEVRGRVVADLGMSLGFWPLFQHIQRREIAMTSPVELDYAGRDDAGRVAASDWTMSFLYREPGLGELGADGDVAVVDRAPLVVLALGVRGGYGSARSNEALGELDRWLASSAEWEAGGAPRALYYNGPDVRRADQWSEVQVPVRRKAR